MSLKQDSAAYNTQLDVLFAAKEFSHNYEIGAVAAAYETLLEACLFKLPGQMTVYTAIDPARMKAFLSRFQRDAFGVYFFERNLKTLCDSGQLSSNVSEDIARAVSGLSIRINSSNPRKTRIAAAFSLWMSACCPFYLTSANIPDVRPEILKTISGRVNFFIATTYLSKYAKIVLGEGEDRKERLDRIYYDLTYRQLNLSSLELLFCSIVRVPERPGASI